MERYQARGIGNNSILCFVCGKGDDYKDEPTEYTPGENFRYDGIQSDMAAFVSNKESGERVVALFDGKACLDYRPQEPDWVQVKVGACSAHRTNLQYLGRLTCCGWITKEKIELARNPEKELPDTVGAERCKAYLQDLADGKKVDTKQALESVLAGIHTHRAR